MTLTLTQSYRSARKQKPLCKSSHKVWSFWMEFGLLLSLASVMNPTFIYLVYLILKRKNPTYVVSLKKKKIKGWHSVI